MQDRTDETRQLIARFFELFDDGTPSSYGSDRFLDMIDTECDWLEISGDQRFDGRRGDKAALRKAVAHSTSDLNNRHARVAETFIDGNRAAVIWTWSAESKKDSRPLVADVLSLFTVTNGLITRWHDRIET